MASGDKIQEATEADAHFKSEMRKLDELCANAEREAHEGFLRAVDKAGLPSVLRQVTPKELHACLSLYWGAQRKKSWPRERKRISQALRSVSRVSSLFPAHARELAATAASYRQVKNTPDGLPPPRGETRVLADWDEAEATGLGFLRYARRVEGLSAFEELVGVYLPALFEKHYGQPATYTKKVGVVGGAYPRFAEVVLSHLHITRTSDWIRKGPPYSQRTIASALDRARARARRLPANRKTK
jgi:hypothetical protein